VRAEENRLSTLFAGQPRQDVGDHRAGARSAADEILLNRGRIAQTRQLRPHALPHFRVRWTSHRMGSVVADELPQDFAGASRGELREWRPSGFGMGRLVAQNRRRGDERGGPDCHEKAARAAAASLMPPSEKKAWPG